MAEEIVYRVASPENHDAVLHFLREHYYKEEPLTISCEPLEQDSYDEEANMSHINNSLGTCVVAMCGDHVVGALMAGPKGPGEEKHLLEEASHIPGTKWGKILLFLAELERKSNVFEKYKVNKAIHGHVLGVDKNFRGRGIGLKLFQRSMERARELGFPLYTTDCTSIYSARLCERAGMDCVSVYEFADYRDQNTGEQILHPPGEHQTVKTFAQRLL